jgi:signal transduction histidine kinase
MLDRFYRGDPSHSSEMPGHGLGLSIAREITRAHAGDILLVKSGSQWTEFYLVLPLAPAPDPAGNEDAENESSDREGSDQEGRFAAPHLIP